MGVVNVYDEDGQLVESYEVDEGTGAVTDEGDGGDAAES